MTFARMTTGDHDTVGAARKRPQDKGRIEASRAHHADEAHVRCVLHARRACQVCGAVTAPVAGKTNNSRFKFLSHRFHSYSPTGSSVRNNSPSIWAMICSS